MKREYPECPIVGVGGVIFHRDAVLLVKRNQEPGLGEWSLPGGVVELGETLVEAFKREVYEEASITIEVGGFVRLLDRIILDQDMRVRFHYVIVDYWGHLVSGQPTPASDISDVCLLPLKQLPQMGVDEKVEETILMAFEKRKRRKLR